MAQVICIASSIQEDDPFILSCNYLATQFDVEIVPFDSLLGEDLLSWASSMKAKLFITNAIPALALSPQFNVVLYITSPFNFNQSVKRQLAARSKQLDIFAGSLEIARQVYQAFSVKPKIQHPYVPPAIDATPDVIVCDIGWELIYAIQQEIPYERFIYYGKPSDLCSAKVYIHCGKDNSIRIPLANSYGVPSICSNVDSDFVVPGNTLLPSNASLKQWAQGIKEIMRDRRTVSPKVKENSRRYSNLDVLAERVKREAAIREKATALGIIPASPNPMQERINQTKSIPNHVMLRPHRPRQSESFVVDEKPLPPPPPVFSFGPYVVPMDTVMATPTWFSSLAPIDVSVIVPMYRSSEEIISQIKTWDNSEDGIKKEVVYVSDGCPQDSTRNVVQVWNNIKTHHDTFFSRFTKKIGRVVILNRNSGYATACNIGAKYGMGKYFIFLDADVLTTHNWVKPMYDLMESDPTIGIVGNLQLKMDGTIDSAGRKWMKDSQTFDHIGRNVIGNKRMTSVLRMSEAPKSMLSIGERDMVGGCCMMVRRTVFEKLGGFDIAYRILSWEDADFNMRVKESGYKVMFHPGSVVYHKGNHSGADSHPFLYDNACLFHSRWVDNGKINSLVEGNDEV